MSVQQQSQNDSGFRIPPPEEAGAPATGSATITTPQAPTLIPLDPKSLNDTSSRDFLIGGVILLVLLIAFFFIRNSYANSLVDKRLSPDKANAAGWWLFIFLASLSTGVILVAVNSAKFLTPWIMVPLAVVALVTLILMWSSSRR